MCYTRMGEGTMPGGPTMLRRGVLDASRAKHGGGCSARAVPDGCLLHNDRRAAREVVVEIATPGGLAVGHLG